MLIKFPKNAFIPLVEVVLLSAIVVVAAILLYSWGTEKINVWVEQPHQDQQLAGDLDFLGLKVAENGVGSILGVRTDGFGYQEINAVEINGETCNVLSTKIVGDITNLELDCDVAKDENYEVFIKSDVGSYIQILTVWEDSNLEISLPFMFRFEFGNTCVNSTRIYGMNYTQNSHAEVANQSSYYYSACAYTTNESITIGTSCSGNYVKLFTLAGLTNSPLYINTSNAAPEPFADYYDWRDVCISSNVGTFDVVYSPTKPDFVNDTYYSCAASYTDDDYNGAHVAGCSQYDDKIWVSLK